jgi:hypothetical protein
MRVADALDETATSTLRRVAAAHSLPVDDSTTRQELIQRICERFSDSAYLRGQVEALTSDQREILASAYASSGELRGLLVDSEHPGAAEDLADRGWLFRVFAAHGPLRGEVFVVPDEVLDCLPAPPEIGLPRPEPGAPPEPRWTDPAFSVFALCSALTRPGGSQEAELKAWSQEPGGWAWDARWNFVHRLAQSTGWLVHRADGVLVASPGLARLLDQPATLAERAWTAYLRDRGWSELGCAGVAGVAPADAPELIDDVSLRQALVAAVDELPEDEWLQIGRISNWLRRVHPTLVREQLTPRGLAQLQAVEWDALELPLLRYVLLGPLYWLGRVAASRDGAVVNRRRGWREAPPEPCRWEGAAELVAPARTRLGALFQAERYLVLRERGRVSRYHVVQAHVAAALGGGGSLADCRRLLNALTQAALPESIDERLAAWDRQFGVLEIRPAVLLEARSAAELDEALESDEVRPFLRKRVGADVVEVAAADALELASALRGAGHLPRVDAALRLAAEPRRAYAGLVDEQVLEFLLVSLEAFRTAWPERLAELEGSAVLLERLERQFPPARLAELRKAAAQLAGTLSSTSVTPRRRRKRKL